MSVLDAVRHLNNETAFQQARQAERMREESANGGGRNTGVTMGKHDFLMLLSAQLRHQDPLNPQSDAEFASQLAQFSSLEQMMNMSESLESMQAFSLVGKYVIAEAFIDGRRFDIAGIVDSIFRKDGAKFAQIGEYEVRVSDINEVFDGSMFPTPEQLIHTSNNLIGRTVRAQVGENVIEGLVTRVTVDRGQMFALIDDGTDAPKFVGLGSIFDIRETSAPGNGLQAHPEGYPEDDPEDYPEGYPKDYPENYSEGYPKDYPENYP